MLTHLKSINNKMFLFTFYLASGILAYYSRMYAKAIDHFQLAEENVMGVVGMMSNAQVRPYIRYTDLVSLTFRFCSISSTGRLLFLRRPNWTWDPLVEWTRSH